MCVLQSREAAGQSVESDIAEKQAAYSALSEEEQAALWTAYYQRHECEQHTPSPSEPGADAEQERAYR